MQYEEYPLSDHPIGCQYLVSVLRFGNKNAAHKVYIQSSLHADELPGALVSFYLRQQLLKLEEQGKLRAQIVLLPLANPIGLQQTLMHSKFGRFEFMTGRNFNRLGSLNLFEFTKNFLDKNSIELTQNAEENKKNIRLAMFSALKQDFRPSNLIEKLHQTLLLLAYDADLVLDLHCDAVAKLHLYTLPQLWDKFEVLARYLGSAVQLVADDSHGNSFDEALSTVWTKLSNSYPQAAIPLACVASTIELRGEYDLSHELAQHDSQALIHYLMAQDFIAHGKDELPPLPDLLKPPTPLAGVETVRAPVAGVVVFAHSIGVMVKKGDKILDIVNPIQGTCHEMFASIDGFIYAINLSHPFVPVGEELMSIAGTEPLPHGPRLSD